MKIALLLAGAFALGAWTHWALCIEAAAALVWMVATGWRELKEERTR